MDAPHHKMTRQMMLDSIEPTVVSALIRDRIMATGAYAGCRTRYRRVDGWTVNAGHASAASPRSTATPRGRPRPFGRGCWPSKDLL